MLNLSLGLKVFNLNFAVFLKTVNYCYYIISFLHLIKNSKL